MCSLLPPIVITRDNTLEISFKIVGDSCVSNTALAKQHELLQAGNKGYLPSEENSIHYIFHCTIFSHHFWFGINFKDSRFAFWERQKIMYFQKRYDFTNTAMFIIVNVLLGFLQRF